MAVVPGGFGPIPAKQAPSRSISLFTARIAGHSRRVSPALSLVPMISKLTDKLRQMTDYMTAGKSQESIETGVFDNTPFDPPRRLVGVPEQNQEHALKEARKILRTAKDRPIEDDEQVIQALAKPSESYDPKPLYYLKVAPTAASHPNLEWNGYRMNLEDAPEHKSDEWVEAASELEIPTDRRGWKLVPQFVSGAYRTLQEIEKRENRPVSKLELAKSNVILARNVEDKAWRYLSELPGVVPPEDGPAWRYVSDAEAEATDANREVNADA